MFSKPLQRRKILRPIKQTQDFLLLDAALAAAGSCYGRHSLRPALTAASACYGRYLRRPALCGTHILHVCPVPRGRLLLRPALLAASARRRRHRSRRPKSCEIALSSFWNLRGCPLRSCGRSSRHRMQPPSRSGMSRCAPHIRCLPQEFSNRIPRPCCGS